MSINKKILILVLIALFLMIDIGYAKNLNEVSVTGTCNIKGKIDIQFANPYIVNAVGVNEDEIKAEVSSSGNELNVIVSNLAYPGAGVEFSTNIINIGTVPAQIESIEPYGLSNNNAIKINILDSFNDKVLQPNETYNIRFSVIWDENYNQSVNEKVDFSIVLNYIQAK